jgi:hypothetical protein
MHAAAVAAGMRAQGGAGAVASGLALAAAPGSKNLFVLDGATKFVPDPAPRRKRSALETAGGASSAGGGGSRDSSREFQLAIGDRWLVLSCAAEDEELWLGALGGLLGAAREE